MCTSTVLITGKQKLIKLKKNNKPSKTKTGTDSESSVLPES